MVNEKSNNYLKKCWETTEVPEWFSPGVLVLLKKTFCSLGEDAL
jgi:hypothetical protein